MRGAVVSERQTAMCRLLEIFLVLALFSLTNSLRLTRVKRLEVEESLREMRQAVKSNQVGHTAATAASEAGFARTEAAVPLGARLSLTHLELQKCLARLDG